MSTNAKSRCSHEENRMKVCAICATKIVFGSNSRSKFIISEDMQNLIRKFSNKDFHLFDSRFPKAICTSCKVRIHERKQGKTARPIPDMPNYVDIQLLRQTRSTSSEDLCSCFICETARLKNCAKNKGGKYVKKESVIITAGNGLFGGKKSAVEDKSTTSNEEIKVTTREICTLCLGIISQDKSHSCSQKVVQKNMVKKIESLPCDTQDKILHHMLATKAKISDTGSTVQNVEMTLRTGGRSARVILNPKKNQQVYFSEEKLDNFVANTGLSFN